jgi:hypothetical protein
MSNHRGGERKKPMSVLKAAGLTLGLTMLFGLMGTLGAFFPDFENPSVFGLYVVWGLAIWLGLVGFWNVRRSQTHWFLDFTASMVITIYCFSGAVRSLGVYLSGWLWIAILAGFCLLVWILPAVNIALAQRLVVRQNVSGRSCLDLLLPFVFLSPAVLLVLLAGGFPFHQLFVFVPGVGFLIDPWAIFIGVLCAMVAIGLGQWAAYQVYTRRRRDLAEGRTTW